MSVRGRVGSLRRIAAGGIVGALALLTGLAAPAAAYPRPGTIELVSAGSDGAVGNSASLTPAISGDGRQVAFSSHASNLVPGDTNGRPDVFVYDRETGAAERVSVATDGAEGNSGASLYPAISGDGRYVAFSSFASNLVAGDTNGREDVFVHDRETGTTERVSVASDGAEADHISRDAALSGDGRYVAFSSFASNLVPGDTNVAEDVFVYDRETGTTERVSVATNGLQGIARSLSPALSADGRHVAFSSFANFVPGDTNGREDVFVHDRETGTTERVSVDSDGAEARGHSRDAAISADGRHVAFGSLASNLVPGDTNGRHDVFVHDRETGTTERVSVASDGAEADHNSPFSPALSDDGRYVAFSSLASNLVQGETNPGLDTFVYDRETGATERVSVTTDGEADGSSLLPAISADGRHVAFYSTAPNLVPGDTNGQVDVFVRDRGPVTGIGSLEVQRAAGQLVVSGWATFSGAIVSAAEDPGDDGEVGARDLGAEIVGASVTYRPEQEDLLARMDLASIPGQAAGLAAGSFQVFFCPEGVPGYDRPLPERQCVGKVDVVGAPGVAYRWAFTVGETAYEVRALAARPKDDPPTTETRFALYECAVLCTETAQLSGALGTTGVEVRVSVPLDTIGADAEDVLTDMRASTSLDEDAIGRTAVLDEVSLADAGLPARSVGLGIAPAGTPESEVTFGTVAELADGRFSGSILASALPPNGYDAWARACLGDNCGAASVSVEREDTILELTVEGRGETLTLTARLAELDAPQIPIAGKTIDFYSDGELIGTIETDDDGVASVPVPPPHRGNNRIYEAVFEGDAFYLGSSNDTSGGSNGGGSEARGG